VTKIINLYCEGMILHVHKDKIDELNLQSVARDFCFREYRLNIFGQFKYFIFPVILFIIISTYTLGTVCEILHKFLLHK
jgi:hypothetical protein